LALAATEDPQHGLRLRGARGDVGTFDEGLRGQRPARPDRGARRHGAPGHRLPVPLAAWTSMSTRTALSSDQSCRRQLPCRTHLCEKLATPTLPPQYRTSVRVRKGRSEEHTSELQSRENLVCRLLLEK